jgi:hypothetical protein
MAFGIGISGWMKRDSSWEKWNWVYSVKRSSVRERV